MKKGDLVRDKYCGSPGIITKEYIARSGEAPSISPAYHVYFFDIKEEVAKIASSLVKLEANNEKG